MKKFLFLSAVACSIVFYACKKDDATSTMPVVEIPVNQDSIDLVAMSAKLQIGYNGTSDTGKIPATSTSSDAPVLDTAYNNRLYYAINGRYVVIYPRVSSGFVAGYYLSVNGVNTYFKVNYAEANQFRAAKLARSGKKGQVAARQDNADSSIVIKLPVNLKGDTFSITYAAYDSINRVSNKLTAVINVLGSADATNNALLQGTWQLTQIRYNDGDWEPFLPNSAGNYNPYYCNGNKLVSGFGNFGNYSYYAAYQSYGRETFTFSANNAFIRTDSTNYSNLDIDSSSCGNPVYVYSKTEGRVTIGGYSYDAATKALTLIYDENGTGQNITTNQYVVKEVTATSATIYQYSLNSYHNQAYLYYLQFTKTQTK